MNLLKKEDTCRETVYAARMARNILWGDERRVPLRNFVRISQTCV